MELIEGENAFVQSGLKVAYDMALFVMTRNDFSLAFYQESVRI